MEAIRHHTGKVYPLNRTNVDTDQIIPKQFLKRIERKGFGQFLFYNWRFHQDGSKKDSFNLHNDKYIGASILVAGDNFGCGSSREHAPWAIEDYGFKVIIASSFADIFYNNCVKNGILPIQLPAEQVEHIMQQAEQTTYQLHVDLATQRLYDDDDWRISFEVNDYHKQMLMNGWDEIAVTLTYEDKITSYENQTLGV
ncbi:3-isopropylmalate dehydratase small subunit [Pontibacillus litoralis]|uniref:3-isopropylmalate dehydratase small subunit n=1 Tax=Pontibacillus litoralis JSM 072002 TaxID=1385512 RepID=A0A0A5G1U7_9BACI|nr:3-isopropylmalate dehydratase small subunit [Pontibacillus litoralis]KGX87066.1 isopropylmalate isomerase [Pontibacillus litoralis JSM 072002]